MRSLGKPRDKSGTLCCGQKGQWDCAEQSELPLEVEEASASHAEMLHSRPIEGRRTTKGFLLRGADRPG